MAISTNSIIHYTKSFDTLTRILEEGFKIKYCSESITLGDGKSSAAHPMISFCDIPLSDSKQHFNTYGKYGIGLSKQWAFKNGVNPVLYIDKNSQIALSLLELLNNRREKNSNLTTVQKSLILQIKAYAKNYMGNLTIKNIKHNDYNFYDEREWRLVPKGLLINNEPFSVPMSEYEKDKDTYNSKLQEIRVKIDVNDISYIIVENSKEIPEMVNFLRNTIRCKSSELDMLFSKICSTEQIIADY